MDRAVELWEVARAGNPDLLTARLPLIGYYMSNGDEGRARAVAAEVQSRNPHITADLGVEFISRSSSRSAGERALLLTNLRKVGLP